jgi:hypothetical protein
MNFLKPIFLFLAVLDLRSSCSSPGKSILFLSFFILFTSCNKEDRFYGDIVETDSTGTILVDIKEQWTPRFDELISDSTFAEHIDENPDFSIYPAYPNPFTVNTYLCFYIKENGSSVRITIYDEPNGKRGTLLDNRLPDGRHYVRWDGYNYDANTETYSKLKNGNYQLKFVYTKNDGSSIESYGNVIINK